MAGRVRRDELVASRKFDAVLSKFDGLEKLAEAVKGASLQLVHLTDEPAALKQRIAIRPAQNRSRGSRGRIDLNGCRFYPACMDSRLVWRHLLETNTHEFVLKVVHDSGVC